jgi:hypothetical protein
MGQIKEHMIEETPQCVKKLDSQDGFFASAIKIADSLGKGSWKDRLHKKQVQRQHGSHCRCESCIVKS